MRAIGFLVFFVSIQAGLCSPIPTVEPVLDPRAIQTTEKPVEAVKQNVVTEQPKLVPETKISEPMNDSLKGKEEHDQMQLLTMLTAAASAAGLVPPAIIAASEASSAPAPAPETAANPKPINVERSLNMDKHSQGTYLSFSPSVTLNAPSGLKNPFAGPNEREGDGSHVTIVNSGHGENVVIINDGYTGDVAIYNGKGPRRVGRRGDK